MDLTDRKKFLEVEEEMILGECFGGLTGWSVMDGLDLERKVE